MATGDGKGGKALGEGHAAGRGGGEGHTAGRGGGEGHGALVHWLAQDIRETEEAIRYKSAEVQVRATCSSGQTASV